MTRQIKRWLLSYAVAAVSFAVMDVAWIATVANNQYRSQIGHLLAPTANLPGAALFYLVYVVGMVHYGIRPNDPGASVLQRVGGAALFGFFTYTTWALTAFAILKGFPALVAVTDIAWGVLACSSVTLITVTLLRRILIKTAA